MAAGDGDILGPTGEKARFFLVGTRVGMVYEMGSVFTPAVQIDPVLPVTITFILTYPDGRQVITSGPGDGFGSFAAQDRWALDIPGVYRFQISGAWQGHTSVMPGLPSTGGEFYVVEKDLPPGGTNLKLSVPSQFSFNAATGFTVGGTTTASVVHYGAVIPGSAVAQGTVTVVNGKFQFNFSPEAIHAIASTYDTTSTTTGRPQIGRVVHLTFFTTETTPTGQTYHAFARLIVRGTTVVYARQP